jgi:hypothetical protein
VRRAAGACCSEELQRSLTQYLTTTCTLAAAPIREALERFLTHREQGIFRAPYLGIRTPFEQADPGWRDWLECALGGFVRGGTRRVPSSGSAPWASKLSRR